MVKYILITAGLIFSAYLLSLIACNLTASGLPFRLFKHHYHVIALFATVIAGFIYLKYGDP